MVLMEQPGKQELKDQFIELRAKGWSYAKIAKKLQVSKSTLSAAAHGRPGRLWCGSDHHRPAVLVSLQVCVGRPGNFVHPGAAKDDCAIVTVNFGVKPAQM
jgi:hypothetical protein